MKDLQFKKAMTFRALIIVSMLTLLPASGFGKTPDRPDNRKATRRPQKTERSLAAQPAVVVSLCVLTGNVDVRGWEKNEVVARSTDGAQIQLKRGDSTAESQPATRIQVVVLDQGDVQRTKSGCQASSDVELNVPRGATVQIQTSDGDVSIADVTIAYAGTQNGSISMQRISNTIEVGSIGGDVCVKDSTGRMDLNSISGSVAATNVRSSDPGDTFEITTVSGDIELIQVAHAHLNVRTVNGNMKLTGPLARGGRYGVNTMSGDVTFALPADASFQLNAKVSSEGDIITDFPLRLLSQAVSVAKPATASTPPTTPVPAAPSATATAPPQRTSPATPTAAPAPPQRTSPATPTAAPASPAPKAPVAEPSVTTVVTVHPVTTVKKVFKVEPVIVTTPYSLRRVNAICGSGDAMIFVASFSGTLHLQKN
jgi:predicted DNA-binding protein with PD1-like motif